MNMRKRYVVLEDRTIRGETMAKRGDIVYDQKGYDYGLSSDDTRATGIEHVTVTMNENGDYPGFTIPRNHLAVAS
jgi:hypothetical protein